MICDFAEYYQIYDYHELRPLICSKLAVGLRDDSRIKMILSSQKLNTRDTLLAGIADRLSLLVWQNSGCKGDRPKSILVEMTRDHSKDVRGFTSGDDLMKELKKYEVVNNGN